MSEDLNPEEIEKITDLHKKIESQLEGIGLYVKDMQIRAGVDEVVLEGMQENGDTLDSLSSIFEAGGSVLVDVVLDVGKVAFTQRVMLSEEEKQVKEMMSESNITEQDIEIDDVLNFDINQELGENNE